MKLVKQTETELVFEKKGLDTISRLIAMIFWMLVVPLIIIAIATPIAIAIFVSIFWIVIIGMFILTAMVALSTQFEETYKFDKSNDSFTIVFKYPSSRFYFQQFLWPIVFWLWSILGKKSTKPPKIINRYLSAIEAVEIIRSGFDKEVYKIHFVLLPKEDSILIPIKFVNSSDGEEEALEVAKCISFFLGLPEPQLIDVTGKN